MGSGWVGLCWVGDDGDLTDVRDGAYAMRGGLCVYIGRVRLHARGRRGHAEGCRVECAGVCVTFVRRGVGYVYNVGLKAMGAWSC